MGKVSAETPHRAGALIKSSYNSLKETIIPSVHQLGTNQPGSSTIRRTPVPFAAFPSFFHSLKPRGGTCLAQEPSAFMVFEQNSPPLKSMI